MSEVKRYLTLSECDYLDVDNFDFNDGIQVMLSYIVPDKSECPFYDDDISNGKESIKIPAINPFDNDPPPKFEYITKSIPMDGVEINKDSEFMFCCSCTDDCSDKMKCECFRSTIESFSYGEDIGSKDVSWVSYEWKRLFYLVDTGIYECNSRCKCNKKCLNRVAQQPIQVKLQIVRTANRGWGIQTTHDIAAGSFICNYEGQIFSEEHAEVAAAKDDFFAQLDLVENISEVKEGFEKEAKGENDDEVISPAQEFRNHMKTISRIYLIDGKRQGNIGRFFNVS
jgi:[histone H3]-N6,N6-dimethyl-lysine9 N-methyltransferase